MATQITTRTIREEALEELRAAVRGEVLREGDPGLDRVRKAYNAMHRGTAEITVRCTGTSDVAEAVRFARAHDLPLAVRGGGHSIAGLSTVEGGMLLDLAPMNGVVVDPERRLAHVQGGALLGDVDHETQRFGLAAPLGQVSATGVAGLSLGGGYGWLRRKHGLACDNIVAAQVVCADGRVRTASEDADADLLWALRGGGGNFGVVTSFTFRLHPVGPEVAFAAVFYPLEEIGDVMRGWRRYVAEAPDEVSSIVVAITFPADPQMPAETHDRPVAIVGGVHAGDAEEGMRVLQPLRELGTPLFDMSGPTPFTAVQSGFDGLFPRDALRSYWKSQYLADLRDEAVDVIAEAARTRPAPTSVVAVFHMGGAVAAVDPEATAFAERSPQYLVSMDANWTEPGQDEEAIAWARSRWEQVGRFGTGGVYLNFMGRDDEPLGADVDSAFGRNLRRLARIKAAYDPDNFFRINNNIEPRA